MRRHGENIGAESVDVAGDLAGRLDRVADDGAAGRVDHVGRRAHRLDDPGLVVGRLKRQHHAAPVPSPQRVGEGVEVERAVGVEGHDVDALAEAMPRQDGGMLAPADDQAVGTARVAADVG